MNGGCRSGSQPRDHHYTRRRAEGHGLVQGHPRCLDPQPLARYVSPLVSVSFPEPLPSPQDLNFS